MKHVKKHCGGILIVCLFSVFASFGQDINIEGQVVDATTSEPLGYVNVILKGKQTGTFTDEAGNFSLSGEVHDTLMISHIGYASKTVALSNVPKTIFLQHQTDILMEVQIKASKKVKREKLGFYSENRKNVMSGVFQYAIFIENERHHPGSIVSVSYPIVHSWQRDKNDKREAKVRIRVYEKDSLTGAPGRDILRENYTVEVKPGQKKIKVNLSDEDIPFLPDGVFIGIDLLGFVDNSGGLANYHISDVKKYLTIPLTDEANLPLTYINPVGSGWMINKIFNPQTGTLEVANVCFGIEVAY